MADNNVILSDNSNYTGEKTPYLESTHKLTARKHLTFETRKFFPAKEKLLQRLKNKNLTCFANPKSASLTTPDASTSKFAPLMSLSITISFETYDYNINYH